MDDDYFVSFKSFFHQFYFSLPFPAEPVIIQRDLIYLCDKNGLLPGDGLIS